MVLALLALGRPALVVGRRWRCEERGVAQDAARSAQLVRLGRRGHRVAPLERYADQVPDLVEHVLQRVPVRERGRHVVARRALHHGSIEPQRACQGPLPAEQRDLEHIAVLVIPGAVSPRAREPRVLAVEQQQERVVERERPGEVARHGLRGVAVIEPAHQAARHLAQRDQLDVGLDQPPVAALQVVRQLAERVHERLAIAGCQSGRRLRAVGEAAHLAHPAQERAQVISPHFVHCVPIAAGSRGSAGAEFRVDGRAASGRGGEVARRDDVS